MKTGLNICNFLKNNRPATSNLLSETITSKLQKGAVRSNSEKREGPPLTYRTVLLQLTHSVQAIKLV